MKLKACVSVLAACFVLPVCGQEAVGDSVGRGWPMSDEADWVGAGVPFYDFDVATARNGDVPEGISALDRDIFISEDFYLDRELWSDPRYYRCNSTLALDAQWGDYLSTPRFITDDPAMGAWGHCDIDYAREHIVSPYGFATAQAHFEALLAETRGRGGPTQYNREQLPPDWDGRYTLNVNIAFERQEAGEEAVAPAEFHEPPQWIIGYHNQVPTILSLLTPDYQLRLVQQLYHQVHNNAAQWSLMFCRPEGFMRWWSGPGGPGALDISVTPSRVQFLGGSGNAIRNVYIDREFDLSGPVPNLGGDIPRLMGESIGFWDGDALITWTSNIRGWFTHSSWEYSNQLQTIEIWTPRSDGNGNFLGLEHEAIFYDEEGLVDPVRSIRFLSRQADFNEVAPIQYLHCNQNIFNVEGRATPVNPGTTIEYEVEDLYGRPWAKIWEEYYEEGMQRPEAEDIFSFE